MDDGAEVVTVDGARGGGAGPLEALCAMPKFTVDLDELRETGVTVVRGFLPPAVCQQAREALDAFLGPERQYHPNPTRPRHPSCC